MNILKALFGVCVKACDPDRAARLAAHDKAMKTGGVSPYFTAPAKTPAPAKTADEIREEQEYLSRVRRQAQLDAKLARIHKHLTTYGVSYVK
jgi:hypothetical protein